MAGSNATGGDADDVTHAILIPLIAVLHSGVWALETVVPSRNARKKPIVWRTVVVFGNEFVVALGRQVKGGSGNANRCQDEDGPAGSAQRPREIEMPAVPEAIVMVKEESHYSHASALDNGTKGQDTDSNLPASGPALDTTRNDDDKSDDGAKLNDNTKGGQEANSAPHVAKGGIFCAVARLGKGNTGACDGRAASVEAIGVFALAVGAVTDPARHRDTCNGHDGAGQGEDEAGGVDCSSRHGGSRCVEESRVWR